MMSEEYTVSIDGWFRSGWHTFKARHVDLLRGISIIIVYSIGLMLLARFIPGGDITGMLVQLTFGLVLTAGWFNYCLRLVREEQVSPTVIFHPFSDYLRVWMVGISMSIAVAAGMILFILPGLYVMARLGMAMFIVVEKPGGVVDTLKYSAKITSGHAGKLFVYYGILIGLYGLSVIPYFTGRPMLGAVTTTVFNFLVTPILGVTYASAYDSLLFLSERPGEGIDPPGLEDIEKG